MLSIIVRVIGVILLTASSAWAAAPASGERLAYRWAYCQADFADASQLPATQEFLRRAKDAGYNGILLEDRGFHQLEQMKEDYFATAESVRTNAESLGLALYPIVFNQGAAIADRNGSEGLPVRRAEFRVSDMRAHLFPNPDEHLLNGNFKQTRTNRLEGWTTQTAPGRCTFADDVVYREDGLSLRLENFSAGDPKTGAVEISQTVPITPSHQYRLSVWVQTKGLNPQAKLRLEGTGTKGQPLLWPTDLAITSYADWTQVAVAFNSLNQLKVNLRLSVVGATSGQVWLDDAQFEEVGLLNVLRRQGCPLLVESVTENKKEIPKVYQEGEDFRAVQDDETDDVHKPPFLQLLAGTKLREGDHIWISYYHAQTIGGATASICLSSPELFAGFKTSAGQVNALLQPKGFLLNLRDLRLANTCQLCADRKVPATTLLSDGLNRCASILHQESPTARLFIWADLFDPTQAGKEPYYFTGEGGWKNAWKSLPKDTVVVNWNGGDKESVAGLARREISQILASDGAPGEIRDWLAKAGSQARIVGVLCANPAPGALEAFAQAAWGSAPAKK